MIKRSLLVFSLTLIVVCIAWLNPKPIPEVPQKTRWVKIGEDGSSLAAWEGPWKCVYSPATNLLWEVKSYAEDLHDHQCSFSWFNGTLGTAKGGDCFVEGEASDTSDLIAEANANKLCGTDNWRLPTEVELQTLLEKRPRPGEPMIALDFFPFGKRGPYWTNDSGVPLEGHYQGQGEGAISINFATGESNNMPYRDAAFVRLVSSIK